MAQKSPTQRPITVRVRFPNSAQLSNRGRNWKSEFGSIRRFIVRFGLHLRLRNGEEEQNTSYRYRVAPLRSPLPTSSVFACSRDLVQCHRSSDSANQSARAHSHCRIHGRPPSSRRPGNPRRSAASCTSPPPTRRPVPADAAHPAPQGRRRR